MDKPKRTPSKKQLEALASGRGSGAGGRPQKKNALEQRAAYLEPSQWLEVEGWASHWNTSTAEALRTILGAQLERLAKSKGRDEATKDLDRHRTGM
jgi:hypothetical protein